MHRARLSTSVAALAFLASVSSIPGEPPAADPNRTRVQVLGKSFSDAFNRGDVTAVAAMYAPDAMAFPPEAEIVKGRPAIEAMWKGVRDLGVESMDFDVLDVQASGILLVETGKANLHIAGAGAAKATVTVKYVVVWKKQKDGSWRISHDIWNSLPTPPPPTATPAPAG